MIWEKYLLADRLRSSRRQTEKDPRNEFESDFGRLLFSPALRRMHDKTQVFPLTTDDNIHSRLTHSMEVMALGHSLGLRIVEDEELRQKIGYDENYLLRTIPVLLKNACLVHDIGNPPFGHFGETVIKSFFSSYFETNDSGLSQMEKEDFTKFVGNAQGFRVLTKLQALNDSYGLNRTFATLGTYLKYPNFGEIDKSLISQSKRGVFQSEVCTLQRIAEPMGLEWRDRYQRHPLSFMMEAADSTCYLVMDIEDGYNKGYYTYDMMKSELSEIPGVKKELARLQKTFTGRGAETAWVVNLRLFLIKRLLDTAVANFKKHFETIENGEYHRELLKDDQNGTSNLLLSFCSKYIFPHREVCSLELTGHSVISGLLTYFTDFLMKDSGDYKKRAVNLLSASIVRAALLENNIAEKGGFDDLSNYSKLRIIVDYVSGMTDQFAVDKFQKISGQKIV